MMQFTREEFAYYYWKVKKVSFDSLYGTSAQEFNSVFSYDIRESFTALNLPQVINASQANTETDLVCDRLANYIDFEMPGWGFEYGYNYFYPLYFGSGTGPAFGLTPGIGYTEQIYRDESGEYYYIQPHFYGSAGPIWSCAIFYTSNKIINNSGGWINVMPGPGEFDAREDVYNMGAVGTFSMTFSFGTKTCPIYGDRHNTQDGRLEPNYTPSATCYLSASQTDTWPYDP